MNDNPEEPVEINVLTERIIGAAMDVHTELGPGLLESAYQACLAAELVDCGIGFRQQVPVSITYKGRAVECGYRLDMLVEDAVVVELKSVAGLERIHTAQMLTYLKLSDCQLGLLINFNVRRLKNGIRRIVHNLPEPLPRALGGPGR